MGLTQVGDVELGAQLDPIERTDRCGASDITGGAGTHRDFVGKESWN